MSTDQKAVVDRLRLLDVTTLVAKVEYSVFGGRLTVCVITLTNGFMVVGESSCIFAEDFKERVGQDEAYKKALNEVWKLAAYVRRQELHDQGGN